jgi:hypothetical protein
MTNALAPSKRLRWNNSTPKSGPDGDFIIMLKKYTNPLLQQIREEGFDPLAFR